jgi:hypothetical protein
MSGVMLCCSISLFLYGFYLDYRVAARIQQRQEEEEGTAGNGMDGEGETRALLLSHAPVAREVQDALMPCPRQDKSVAMRSVGGYGAV